MDSEQKRHIAWNLRASGATVREIHGQYGWPMATIYDWGKDEVVWKERKRKRGGRRRERYHTDPEYRNGINDRARKWQEEHPLEHRRSSREWYRKKHRVLSESYRLKEKE